AKAFLITPRTLAQRIVRAKTAIREIPIPYEVPTPEELPERLGGVLQVVYLVFNEGYSAAAGAEGTPAGLNRAASRHETRPRAFYLGAFVGRPPPGPETLGFLPLYFQTEPPPRRENLSERRPDFAGNPGSLALEPGADRRRSGIAREAPKIPPLRLIHSAGC